MIAAVLFTSISFAFWMILIFQFILGIGMSGYHPVGISAVADLFPKKGAGKAMSVQAIGGSLGVALAPLILGGLASFYGWRIPLRFLALAGIPLLLVIVLWMDEPKPEQKKEKEPFSLTFITIFIALFYFFRGFVFKSITTFLPTYFVEVRGLSVAGGGFTTSVLLLSGVLILPVAGIVADRVNRILVVVSSSLSSGFILFALTLMPTVGWLMYIMLALFGALIYLSLPSVLSLVKDLTSKEGYGGTFGINFTMVAFAGVIAPVIIGYIGDVFSLALAFKLLPLLLVLASISILLIKNKI